MNIDDIGLRLNIDQFKVASREVIADWDDMKKSMIRYQNAAVKFTNTTEGQIARIHEYNAQLEDGRTLTIKYNEATKQTSAIVKDLTIAQQKLAEVEKKRKHDRESERSSRQMARKNAEAFVSSNMSIDPNASIAEVARFDAAKKSLIGFAEESKTYRADLNRVYDDIINKRMVQYDKRLTTVREKIIRLMEAEQNLGRAEQKRIDDNAKVYQKHINNLNKETAIVYTLMQKRAQEAADEQRKIKNTEKINHALEETLRLEKQSDKSVRDKYTPKFGPNQDEMIAYVKAKAAVASLANQHKISESQIRDMWKRVLHGDIRVYHGTLNTLQSKLIEVSRAHQRFGKEAYEANQRLNMSTVTVTQSMKTFGRLLIFHAAHRTLTFINRNLKDAVGGAIELQKAIAEIQTLDTVGKLPFDYWQEGVKNLSDTFGLDIIDQAKAAYEALSNQIVESSDAFRFLSEANRFALATVSSVEDSVKTLSAAINAYGMNADDARRLSEMFFKSIDLGRITADEMADTIGRVAVPSSQLGISLEEMNAALDVITVRGVKADEAMTLFRNILLKLIRPTEEMKEFFREIGVTTGEAAIKAYGFGNVLSMIEKRSKGSSDEIGELFGRVRAITGMMVFGEEGLKDYENALRQLQNAEADYARATGLVMDNLGKRIEKRSGQIKNFLKVEIGNAILSIMSVWIEKIADVSDSLYSIVDATGKAYNDYKRIEQDLIADQRRLREQLTDIIREQVDESDKLMARLRVETNKEMSKLEDDQIKIFENIHDAFKAAESGILDVIEDNVQVIKNKVRDLRTELNSIKKDVFKRNVATSEYMFDFKLNDKGLKDQIKLIEKQIRDLTNPSGITDVETMRVNYEQAFDLEKKLTDLKKQTSRDVNRKSIELKIMQEELDALTEKFNLKISETDNARTRVKLEKEYIKERDKLLKKMDKKREYDKEEKAHLKRVSDLTKRHNTQSDILLRNKKNEINLLNKQLQKERELAELKTTFTNIQEFSIKSIFGLDPEEQVQAIQEQKDYITRYQEILKDTFGVKPANFEQATIDKQMKQLELAEERAANRVAEIEAQDKLREAQSQLRGNIDKVSDASKEKIDVLFKSYERVMELAAKFNVSVNQSALQADALNLGDVLRQVEASYAKLNAQANYINPLTGVKSNPFGIDPKQLRSDYNELRTLLQAKVPSQRQDAEAGAYDLQQLKKQLEEFNTQLRDSVNQYLPEEQKLTAEKEAQAKTGYEILNTLQKSTTAVRDQINATRELISEQRKAITVTTTPTPTPTVTPTPHAYGTRRIGMDTIPAMLSPGEFVMNSKSTGKFYSQLLSMNSGAVKHFNAGGPVTVNGGLNINYKSSGNQQVDVLRVAKAIKTEIRRKTFSWD